MTCRHTDTCDECRERLTDALSQRDRYRAECEQRRRVRDDVAALLGLAGEQRYDDAAISAAVARLRRYLAAAANRETVRAVAENNPRDGLTSATM
jgi:hypothetical protein